MTGDQLRPSDIDSSDVGRVEVGWIEAGRAEVGRAEAGPTELGSAGADVAEVGSADLVAWGRHTGRWSSKWEMLALLAAGLVAITYFVTIEHGPPRALAPSRAAQFTVVPEPSGRPRSLAENVDGIPLPQHVADLPRLITALPYQVNFDVPAKSLSSAPVDRAVALFAEYGYLEAGALTQGLRVVVLGRDGRLRRLDLGSLSPAADPAGNQHSPASSTTLSPDGTLAAFPQRDAILLVDLTTGMARQIPVPGYNEWVLWRGRELYVQQSGQTLRVDVATGATSRTPFDPGLGVVSSPDPANPVATLDNRGSGSNLRTWADGEEISASILVNLPDQASWLGTGFATGASAARVLVPDRLDHTNTVERSSRVVVVDTVRADIIRQLVLSTGGPGDQLMRCCEVLGWLQPQTVLLQIGGAAVQQVLAWGLDGTIFRVTEVVGMGDVAISLAAPPLLSPTGASVEVSTRLRGTRDE